MKCGGISSGSGSIISYAIGVAEAAALPRASMARSGNNHHGGIKREKYGVMAAWHREYATANTLVCVIDMAISGGDGGMAYGSSCSRNHDAHVSAKKQW